MKSALLFAYILRWCSGNLNIICISFWEVVRQIFKNHSNFLLYGRLYNRIPIFTHMDSWFLNVPKLVIRSHLSEWLNLWLFPGPHCDWRFMLLDLTLMGLKQDSSSSYSCNLELFSYIKKPYTFFYYYSSILNVWVMHQLCKDIFQISVHNGKTEMLYWREL